MHNLSHKTEPIIRRAGEILLGYFRKPLKRITKEVYGSFVTEADLASEKYLIAELATIIPQVSFFAEESGKSGAPSDYCWVIDPLDGTTNFAHGLDYFCISIALTYKDEPIFGMVYRPITDELFWAEKNNGAYLNNEVLKVSEQPAVQKGLFGACLPYGEGDELAHALVIREKVAQQSYGLRTFGAVALDISLVAAGRLDGVFFENLGWWDVAAGMLIVQEAGGKVSDYKGRPIGSKYKTFLAANDKVYAQLLGIIQD